MVWSAFVFSNKFAFIMRTAFKEAKQDNEQYVYEHLLYFHKISLNARIL